MTLFCAFLLIQILGTVLCAQDWAYEEGIDGVLGPREWYKAYNNCNGSKQSPVNIFKRRLVQRDDLIEEHQKIKSVDIHFSNATLTNNGLYLVLKSDDMREVALFLTQYEYQLAEIRFHWGKDDSVGSENMFDGKRYSMEVQLVFFRSSYFKTYEECLEKGFGLFIVAVEYQISSEDNEVISEVVDALESIQEVGTTKVIEKMKSSLEQFLPANRVPYYFYKGSLTTPPCASGDWFIYMDKQTISSNQLAKFRQLNAKYGGKLTSNDRPIFRRPGQVIYYNVML